MPTALPSQLLERVRERASPPWRTALISGLLEELSGLGCRFEVPPARVQDYLNVWNSSRPHGRLACVNLGSGRVMFQAGSWERVHRLSPRFSGPLARDCCSHPLDAAADLRVIVASSKIEIARAVTPAMRPPG